MPTFCCWKTWHPGLRGCPILPQTLNSSCTFFSQLISSKHNSFIKVLDILVEIFQNVQHPFWGIFIFKHYAKINWLTLLFKMTCIFMRNIIVLEHTFGKVWGIPGGNIELAKLKCRNLLSASFVPDYLRGILTKAYHWDYK